ncbi:Hint domain-containing protein [Amycolatopsis sp. NPDC051372]|uniref:Hint domain-containing protein n=1 Tax=Amycolatopsis sp. NPDC051372 TaxID=3155669 RepID=UPI0034393640
MSGGALPGATRGAHQRRQANAAAAAITTAAAAANQAEYEEAKKAAADKRSWVDVAIQVGGDILQEIFGVKGIVDNCIKDFYLAACGWEVLTALPWGKILKGGKIVTAFKDTLSWIRRRDKAMADLRAVEAAERRLSSIRGCNSFSAGTLVLTGDGTKEPIEDVKVGDKVRNAEPDNRNTEIHTVTALHITDNDRDFVDVTIATPSGPEKITSTAHHLWRDVTTHTSTDATDLKPGDLLDTPGNGNVAIKSLNRYTGSLRTYNLTIGTTHTY